MKRHQETGHEVTRRAARVLVAICASALLAACGGGGDDAPAVNVGSPSQTGMGVATSPPAAIPPAASPDTGGAESAPAGEPAVSSAPGAVTLTWTPPTTYDDGKPLKITGYRIYWGNTDDYFPYSVTLDNPGLTRYVVEQLAPATYYFVATALSEKDESAFSNVFAMKVR
jgi:hypothetical protein